MYHLLLFFHMQPANQPTITVAVLDHKTFGRPCCKYFINSGLYFWGHGLQYLVLFISILIRGTGYLIRRTERSILQVSLVRVHRHSGFAWKKICDHNKQNAILWRSRNIKSSSNVYSSYGNNITGYNTANNNFWYPVRGTTHTLQARPC
jgi:hypothetical protein